MIEFPLLYRPEVVGWGYTDSGLEKSNFNDGGSSASQFQQSLDVPVLSAAEVKP
jgi:hypothetical protein